MSKPKPKLKPKPVSRSLFQRRRSVLLALCWYDYRVHSGAARYAQEHDWILHSEMGHTGLIPQEWKGDGVISCIGTEKKSRDLAKFVQRINLPTVNIGLETLSKGLRIQGIYWDTAAIGRMAAQHFLDRNFRHFACYVEHRDYINDGLSHAFRDTVNQAGYECDIRSWKRRSGLEWEKERTRQEGWLGNAKRPLAVFAVSDLLAIRIMASCLDIGLQIPEDVAILGCHNDAMDCLSAPIPLSSIETNEEGLGYQAAAILDQMMSGEKLAPAPILIQPAGVITRHSTDTLATRHSAVQRVLRFIRENYAKPITSTDLAAVAGMSRFGMEKAFKTQLNLLPIQELRRIRLETAQRLLGETDHKIETIAHDAGFRDATAMGVAFRRRFGLSPKKWRRQEQEKKEPANSGV